MEWLKEKMFGSSSSPRSSPAEAAADKDGGFQVSPCTARHHRTSNLRIQSNRLVLALAVASCVPHWFQTCNAPMLRRGERGSSRQLYRAQWRSCNAASAKTTATNQSAKRRSKTCAPPPSHADAPLAPCSHHMGWRPRASPRHAIPAAVQVRLLAAKVTGTTATRPATAAQGPRERVRVARQVKRKVVEAVDPRPVWAKHAPLPHSPRDPDPPPDEAPWALSARAHMRPSVHVYTRAPRDPQPRRRARDRSLRAERLRGLRASVGRAAAAALVLVVRQREALELLGELVPLGVEALELPLYAPELGNQCVELRVHLVVERLQRRQALAVRSARCTRTTHCPLHLSGSCARRPGIPRPSAQGHWKGAASGGARLAGGTRVQGLGRGAHLFARA